MIEFSKRAYLTALFYAVACISCKYLYAADVVWSAIADISTPREKVAAAYVNRKVYVIGGFDGVSPLKTVEEYDPLRDDWAPKAQMSSTRYGAGAAVVNDKIYVIGGGQASSYLNRVEEYNPATDTWSQKSPMPTPREGLAVAAVGGKIYAIGGKKGSLYADVSNVVEEYSPDTDSWTTKASMPTPRLYPGSGVIGNKIYILGGQRGTTCYATVDVYDPAMDTWSSAPSMPAPLAGIAVGVAGKKLFVFGGFDGTNYFSAVNEYDSVTGLWSSKAAMSDKRAYGAIGVRNNTFYLVGGSSGRDVTFLPVIAEHAEKGVHNVPVLSWLGDSNYESKGVYPETDTPSTNFVFKMSYSHYSSYEPGTGYPKVHITKDGLDISGSPFLMNYLYGPFGSGAVYNYNTYLSTGNYVYYFEAYDDRNEEAIGDAALPRAGLNVIYDPEGGAGLSNAYCYPSPARITKGELIRFSGITPHAVVSVLTSGGNVVKKLFADDTGVIRPWDGSNDSGELLASGLYMVHARDNRGNKKIFNIVIVR